MAQECRPGRTALVLSGGGVKGLAHIGVLEVLDSLGVRPDLVIGTSMGAIIGGLYAAGYTARQIDSLARDLPISEIVRPFGAPGPHPWDRRIPLISLARGKTGFTFQTGVVDETKPNARLNSAMLRGNLLARGRFSRLPIPFLAVATDLRNRAPVVLAEGDLARAVRASSAIPLVFPPVIVGDSILVDGGLSANVPVAQARAAGATRVIVVDVSEHPSDSIDAESPLALADRVLGFLFHQPAATLGPDDILVRPSVQGYRTLDFSPETVAEVRSRGRQAADSTIGRARCLPLGKAGVAVEARPLLARWQSATGGADSVLMTRMLRLAVGPLDPDRLRARLVALGESESLRGIWLNPTSVGEGVALRIEPIRAPRAVGGAGLAYDTELGAEIWGGVFDRGLFGSELEASGLISVGRFAREAYGAALWHTDAGWARATPISTVRLRGEDVRRFDPNGRELPTLGTVNGRATAGVEFLVGRRLRVRVGVEGLTWGSDGTRGDAAFGSSLLVERRAASGLDLSGEVVATASVRWAKLAASWHATHRGWHWRPEIQVGWGDQLPAQWTLPLGGADGFPGLHIGERRGTRELAGVVNGGVRFLGPIEIRATVAVGRAWIPGPNATDWIGGGRIGLGADTPAGPIDVGYGAATNGRRALYLRVGQWF